MTSRIKSAENLERSNDHAKNPAELSEMRETIAAKKAATESAEVSRAREIVDAMLLNAHQCFIRNPDHQPRSNVERVASTRLSDVLEGMTQAAKTLGVRGRDVETLGTRTRLSVPRSGCSEPS